MTDLKKMLDEAAGPELPLTDAYLSRAVILGRRSRRRRGLTVAAATAVVAVGAGGWALGLPSAGDTPVAAGAGPSTGPTTCAQLVTDHRIERTKHEPQPGEHNADGIGLRLGDFPRQTEPAVDGESVPGMWFGWPMSQPRDFAPTATIEVPPPGAKGWPKEVWTEVIRTCYPVR
ncbi:hypothetical protein BWI15_02680 [Kribbella sp. ALI-6-A]|uniref:hypothetical protein n=1 Tax=Kribbella sp. ALI-6-A TaxID=1933817 RepID=UPI00097BB377|nr:hypothetical protein [Kribbella sp. ALI-6-A]ONI77438.1 hypothetical protein BWI15_02680 [Kribbella sp. ALI-6-A]